ncbi:MULTISPECIES: hypothetical protein [unclassified Endozoicomonas]|uniref:hypothetical protein n=1 Tax=unclassified Endozoicomonas TaxID=2644528 RepID=UPI0021479819|nr:MULTISPECIES: hypothetical protein [unclassified Endozoicomonas]
MAELKLANPPPEWVGQVWIEGQSAFTLSEEDDDQFNIKFIATDTNTGAILSAGQYRCQLGSAVKLWRTPHGHQGVGSFYGYWVLSSVISLIGGWLAGVFTTGFSASSIR